MPKALLLALALLLLAAQPVRAQMTDQQRAKEWFVEHDRNHDGYITLDEVMNYEAKRFRRMDAEGNGRLRQDEYCGGIPATNLPEIDRCHARFAKIDTDHDSYVTLDEIQAYISAILQAADQNQDGNITEAEFMAVAVGAL
jgi:Ca2+-binding EF-hand superfamily protein